MRALGSVMAMTLSHSAFSFSLLVGVADGFGLAVVGFWAIDLVFVDCENAAVKNRPNNKITVKDLIKTYRSPQNLITKLPFRRLRPILAL